jgi:carboxypeptidase Taq
MKKDINVDQLLSEGDFLSVKKWLIDNIYQHGAMYKSKDLIKKVCNEEFDANYYIQYLKNKFLK